MDPSVVCLLQDEVLRLLYANTASCAGNSADWFECISHLIPSRRVLISQHNRSQDARVRGGSLHWATAAAVWLKKSGFVGDHNFPEMDQMLGLHRNGHGLRCLKLWQHQFQRPYREIVLLSGVSAAGDNESDESMLFTLFNLAG